MCTCSTFTAQLGIKSSKMFFTTLKDSATGQRLAAIEQRMNEAISAQKEVAAKYNITQWRRGHWGVAGRFSAVYFANTPDLKIWKLVLEPDGYMPKLNTKEGKAINKEFAAMPKVHGFQLNECVGITNQDFGNIGVSFGNAEMFGFSVSDNWKFTCPEDCLEVTITVYRQLFGTDGKQRF